MLPPIPHTHMLALYVLGGYLVGSIPVAWLLTKLLTGQDLRALGSGNVGVMNTALSVHRWTAALVFVAELAKGALAVLVPQARGANEFVIGCTALAAVVGTRWSIWLKLRGGRGNTAGVGALAVYSPLTLVVMVAFYLGARRFLDSNFLAMRATLVALPIVFGILMASWVSALMGAGFSLIFLSTHHPETDDHLLVKQKFPTLWAFLTAPPRKK